MTMDVPDGPDVLIAGGGPNGLLLACELSLAGVSPVVLERLPEPSMEPKANGIIGQAVRWLDCRGLYERAQGTPGAPRPAPAYFFGAMPLDLRELDDNPLHGMMIPQHRLERLLAQRADELGVRVLRGHRLTGLAQDEHGVTVDVEGPDGGYRQRCRYLAGCDGAHGTVRGMAGIGFPGTTSTTVVSRVAHVTLPESMILRDTAELALPGGVRLGAGFTRTAHGVVSFAELEPGRPMLGTMEWGSPVPGDDTPMTLDELRHSLRRVLGVAVPLGPPDGPGPHHLRRRAEQNTRVAEAYRSGRVLLAGDAAHVHSAMGGPGLNLGMQDVANLGWKLAAQLHGWAPPGLLDSYHAERHPVARRVAMHTGAQTALISPGQEVTALRELFGELLHDTGTARRIAHLLAGADLPYPMPAPGHPLLGRFVPDLALHTASGPARTAELLRTARPVLLDLGGMGEPHAVAAGWKDRVDVIEARCPDAPAGALLIRPDGYVAWAAGQGDGDVHSGLGDALHTWFGAPANDQHRGG